jgi:hypothetical protein
MAASGESRRVFAAAVMAGVPDVASAIACFIGVETVECVLATLWQGSAVAMMRIIAIVYVAIETVMSMEPGAGTDKDAIREPIRPIVAIRGAIIRRVVEIAVRTIGLGANVDAYGDLGRRRRADEADEAQ